ncbi:MAG: hypothetical protein ABSH32_17000, partial [Bryobacteraceae bacterium]
SRAKAGVDIWRNVNVAQSPCHNLHYAAANYKYPERNCFGPDFNKGYPVPNLGRKAASVDYAPTVAGKRALLRRDLLADRIGRAAGSSNQKYDKRSQFPHIFFISRDVLSDE